MSSNQHRLLYLIDLHTRDLEESKEKETTQWIKKQALAVLIYEGIIANVFDYDYAPQSTLIDHRRIWLNISHEGQSDIEFLREEELLCGLQVPSRSYKPIICYQLSTKGKDILKRVPQLDKEAVHSYAYKSGSRELLKPVWDGSFYRIQGTFSGYEYISNITETEDVSYVSSAYIPQCLRFGGRPTLSNAHRAIESGIGASDNIRDDDLDEVITLNSVSTIVAEYIPFGANLIVQLNNNVGSSERIQGGYICPLIDNDTTSPLLELSPDLTSVEVLDYSLTSHVNMEAEIRLPEDPGIIQVETFGISLNAEGTTFYGMQMEAVMGRIKDNVSLDHLSRILVDVQQDSSIIVDSLLTQYQRDLLNNVFLGDSLNRNKVNLIIANEITPHLTAEEYMDKGEYEHEFQQVIGDTKAAYDISENDTLIFGAQGLLVVGPNSRRYEPLLCSYLQFVTIDTFLQNYFARMWILDEDLSKLNKAVDCISIDPGALPKSRDKICVLSKDIIQLEQILGHLLEAIDMMEVPPEPKEQTGRALFDRLELSGMCDQLSRRVKDIRKNISAEQRYLDVIREKTNVSADTRNFEINSILEYNIRRLCTMQRANRDTSNSLQILQVIFSGMFAFDILDRITGDWTVLDSSWMKHFVRHFILNNMLLWFFISITFWVVLASLTRKIFLTLQWKGDGLTTLHIQIDQVVYIDKLNMFVAAKQKTLEDRKYIYHSDEGSSPINSKKDVTKTTVLLSYDEYDAKSWGGTCPTITLEYHFGDGVTEKIEGLKTSQDVTAYLLKVCIKYNRRDAKRDLAFNANELREKLMQELQDASIFVHKDFKIINS